MKITTKKYYPKLSKKKLMMLCNRCGCQIQLFEPDRAGASCAGCVNNQFNHVVLNN